MSTLSLTEQSECTVLSSDPRHTKRQCIEGSKTSSAIPIDDGFIKMKMNMERRWRDIDRERQQYSEKNLV